MQRVIAAVIITITLVFGLSISASAQILTIDQTEWKELPVQKRWIKTATVTYIPASPQPTGADEDGYPTVAPPLPLGYIESLYCKADPNWSPRCNTGTAGSPWDLSVTFAGAGEETYKVVHSSGRLVRGTMDTITSIPYGVVSQRYYPYVEYDKEDGSENRIEATVNGRTSMVVMMTLPYRQSE